MVAAFLLWAEQQKKHVLVKLQTQDPQSGEFTEQSINNNSWRQLITFVPDKPLYVYLIKSSSFKMRKWKHRRPTPHALPCPAVGHRSKA